MYTYGLWDFQSTTIFLVIAIAVIFPLQLLLCFKGKSLLVRLCPVLLTLLLTVIPWIAVWITKSWLFLVIGYLALYYAAFFLIACGAGWGIRALVTLIARLRS
jgi:hypothetical protein